MHMFFSTLYIYMYLFSHLLMNSLSRPWVPRWAKLCASWAGPLWEPQGMHLIMFEGLRGLGLMVYGPGFRGFCHVTWVNGATY